MSRKAERKDSIPFQNKDRKEKFEHILKAIVNTVEAQFGIFYLKDEKNSGSSNNELKIFCHYGFTPDLNANIDNDKYSYEIGDKIDPSDDPIGITAYVAISKNSVRLHGEGIYQHRNHTGKTDDLLKYIDFERDKNNEFYSKEDLHDQSNGKYKAKSILLVPVYDISRRQKVLGVLKVENKKKKVNIPCTPFTSVDRTLLEIIAETFAVEYWREEKKCESNIREFLDLIKSDAANEIKNVLKVPVSKENKKKRCKYLYSLLNLCREYEIKGQYDRCIEILDCIIWMHTNKSLNDNDDGFWFRKYDFNFTNKDKNILKALRNKRDEFCFTLFSE